MVEDDTVIEALRARNRSQKLALASGESGSLPHIAGRSSSNPCPILLNPPADSPFSWRHCEEKEVRSRHRRIRHPLRESR